METWIEIWAWIWTSIRSPWVWRSWISTWFGNLKLQLNRELDRDLDLDVDFKPHSLESKNLDWDLVWELRAARGSGLQNLNLGFEKEDGWDLVREPQAAPGSRPGLRSGPGSWPSQEGKDTINKEVVKPARGLGFANPWLTSGSLSNLILDYWS
jgi:hypothetical protein